MSNKDFTFLSSLRRANIVAELAAGKKPEAINVSRSGFTNNQDAGDALGMLGAYDPISTPEALTLVSTDAKDSSGGGGAETISVLFVNGSGDLAYEEVALTGTTPVSMTSTGYGTVDAWVETADGSVTNAGRIDIEHTSGTILAGGQIPAAAGASPAAVICVPNGYVLLVYRVRVFGPGSNRVYMYHEGFSGSPKEAIIGAVYTNSAAEGESGGGSQLPIAIVEPGHFWMELFSGSSVPTGYSLEAMLVRA